MHGWDKGNTFYVPQDGRKYGSRFMKSGHLIRELMRKKMFEPLHPVDFLLPKRTKERIKNENGVVNISGLDLSRYSYYPISFGKELISSSLMKALIASGEFNSDELIDIQRKYVQNKNSQKFIKDIKNDYNISIANYYI